LRKERTCFATGGEADKNAWAEYALRPVVE
jgi:hypothetical protein